MTADVASGQEILAFLAAMRDIRCIHCGSSSILLGQSRSWSEDRKTMRASMGTDPLARAKDWLATGEIGNSARTIHDFMTRGNRERTAHPLDVSDLRRCLLLLRRVPEWIGRMDEMAVLSPEWARIAAAWDDLARSFTRETGPDWRRVPTPRTGEILDVALRG